MSFQIHTRVEEQYIFYIPDKNETDGNNIEGTAVFIAQFLFYILRKYLAAKEIQTCIPRLITSARDKGCVDNPVKLRAAWLSSQMET